MTPRQRFSRQRSSFLSASRVPKSSEPRILRGLQPWLREAAQQLLRLAGPSVRVTSVRRSRAQQARLYRRYLAGKSRFPALPPGRSLHEIGRAFDLVGSPETLRRLGGIWEAWGGRWGGRDGSDPIHFEA